MLLNKWLRMNVLTLKIKKTQYLVFGQKKTENYLNITIREKTIAKTKSAYYLGVVLNENFTWSKHTKKI